MQDALIQQGVELMLYGMGTVFVFLALLVALTTLMSTILNRCAKRERVTAPAVTAQAGVEDEQLIAVISSAIHQHRSRKK